MNTNSKHNDTELSSINLKNLSLNRLNQSFIKHISAGEYKKSDLLAYWINDFANYHDNEKCFNSNELKRYKRGDIIKVDLGFNIRKRTWRPTLLYCDKQTR